MASASDLLTLGAAGFVLRAIAISLTAIFTLIGYIWLRRVLRSRYFARRVARAYAIRQQWNGILSGRIPAYKWRGKEIDREVVETMLLDSIEGAEERDLPHLLARLRISGLLDARLREARKSSGWKQRAALIALGRTRAHEAIGPLVDALASPDLDIRTAAVRGLGASGSVKAAIPLLDRLVSEELDVPAAAISTALVQCCGANPRELVRYFRESTGETRDLLSRVLSEVDVGALGEDLLPLLHDASPEVRASVARGLAKLQAFVAIPALLELTMDEFWFVRLRAVVALGEFQDADVIEPLVRMLTDPNRLVRQRAAAALAHRKEQLPEILSQIVRTGDRYALQAMLSELERAGESEEALKLLNASEHAGLVSAVSDARQQLELRTPLLPAATKVL